MPVVEAGAEHLLDLGEERLGEPAVGVLQLVLGQDQHRQLGQPVAGEHVDRVRPRPSRGRPRSGRRRSRCSWRCRIGRAHAASICTSTWWASTLSPAATRTSVDLAVGGRRDPVLDLHGLEHDERLAGRDDVAGRDLDRDDPAGHRRGRARRPRRSADGVGKRGSSTSSVWPAGGVDVPRCRRRWCTGRASWRRRRPRGSTASVLGVRRAPRAGRPARRRSWLGTRRRASHRVARRSTSSSTDVERARAGRLRRATLRHPLGATGQRRSAEPAAALRPRARRRATWRRCDRVGGPGVEQREVQVDEGGGRVARDGSRRSRGRRPGGRGSCVTPWIGARDERAAEPADRLVARRSPKAMTLASSES